MLGFLKSKKKEGFKEPRGVRMEPEIRRFPQIPIDEPVREHAATPISEEDAIVLIERLGDTYTGLQNAAVSVLKKQSQLPDKAITGLVQLLEHENPLVRSNALLALQGQSRLPDIALKVLMQLFEDTNSGIRSGVATILQRQIELPETATLTLIRLLAHKDYSIRYNVSLILEKQSQLSLPAVTGLVRLLEDDNLRSTAQIILKKHATHDTIVRIKSELTERPQEHQSESEPSLQVWPDTEKEPNLSRTIAACGRCTSAKIRCDGKIPACSACERAGKASHCHTANENKQEGLRMPKESVHEVEESLQQGAERARLQNAAELEHKVSETHARQSYKSKTYSDPMFAHPARDDWLPEASFQDYSEFISSMPRGQQTVTTSAREEPKGAVYQGHEPQNSELIFSNTIADSLGVDSPNGVYRWGARYRAGLGCSRCRARKAKCDGKRPCKQCQSRGWTSDCSYPVSRELSTDDASIKAHNTKVDMGESTHSATPLLPTNDEADGWVKIDDLDLRREEYAQLLTARLAAAEKIAQSLTDIIRSTSTNQLVSSALVKHCVEEAKNAQQMLFEVSDSQDMAISDALAASVGSTRQRLKAALMRHHFAVLKANDEAVRIEQTEEEESVGVSAPRSMTQPSCVDLTEYYETHRVCWTCVCGVQLFDDYIELIPGSVAKLQARLADENKPKSSNTWLNYWIEFIKEAFTSLSPTSSPTTSSNTSSPTSHSGDTMVSPPTSDSGLTQVQSRSAQPENDCKPGLTGHQSTQTPIQSTNDTSVQQFSSIPERILYLLLCFPVGFTGLKLHHAQILLKQLGNDRQLFQLLGRMYTKGRENVTFTSKMSLRTVTRVSLSHFLVDLSDLVDLKPHSSICGPVTPGCRCLPPADMISPAPSAEYVCDPAEPDYMPPFGVNYLTHYFQNPSHLNPSANWVLRQVPKRMAGQLMAGADAGFAKGWGLAFEEGWDRRRIGQRVLALVVLGSLLFGILFAILKKDIQSAFSISACVISVLAIVGGYFGSGEPRGFVQV